MGKVEATIEIGAPLAEVWDLYFERSRWPTWVDGFGSVESERGYPEAGGELVWRSGPAGRGTVNEKVLAHEPRTLHRVSYEDPGARGELEVSFEMLPAADEVRNTKVTQRTSYKVLTGGPIAPLTDLLFIRSQMRRSLERSLIDLRLEAERTGAAPAAG